MSVIVKITLVVALLLSIVIPFGAFAAGEKTKGRYETALAVNCFCSSEPWCSPER